jgi:hypothetical protein
MRYIQAQEAPCIIKHYGFPALFGLPPPLLLLCPEFSAPPSVSPLGFDTSVFAGETSNGFPDPYFHSISTSISTLQHPNIPRLRQQSSSPFADLWSLDQKMLPLAWQIHHLCQILNILSLPCRCYFCLHCPFVVILEVVSERRDVGFELRMARDVIWENEGIVVLLGGRSTLLTSLGRLIWIDYAKE